jgi:hypothetical protein
VRIELIWPTGNRKPVLAGGLAAIARFLIGSYVRQRDPLDSVDLPCHPAKRLDRKLQLPAEPDHDRPNKEV